MKKKIVEFLGRTVPQLVFALLAGCAYFMILLPVITIYSKGSSFLAFQFSPLIICGAALVIIKLMKQARENENYNAIFVLFVIHVLLFVMSIVFTISMF